MRRLSKLNAIVCAMIFAAAISMLILLALVAGAPLKQPQVVFVTGDHEYSSEETMPLVAAELEKHYGMQTTVLKAYPDENAEENIPGLEALDKADVAVFFLRWRRLPAAQLEHIRKYLDASPRYECRALVSDEHHAG